MCHIQVVIVPKSECIRVRTRELSFRRAATRNVALELSLQVLRGISNSLTGFRKCKKPSVRYFSSFFLSPKVHPDIQLRGWKIERTDYRVSSLDLRRGRKYDVEDGNLIETLDNLCPFPSRHSGLTGIRVHTQVFIDHFSYCMLFPVKNSRMDRDTHSFSLLQGTVTRLRID